MFSNIQFYFFFYFLFYIFERRLFLAPHQKFHEFSGAEMRCPAGHGKPSVFFFSRSRPIFGENKDASSSGTKCKSI
jgi:hypothetical protein